VAGLHHRRERVAAPAPGLELVAEVAILRNELARAHASLRLEEQRNRKLPALEPIASAAEYERGGNEAVTKWMAFLQKNDVMQIHGYMDPALRAQIGRFVPEDSRNLFAIASHLEPLTLYAHFYHWGDLAQMREQPHASPIRRGPLLYNIWDSRAEGMATAMEAAGPARDARPARAPAGQPLARAWPGLHDEALLHRAQRGRPDPRLAHRVAAHRQAQRGRSAAQPPAIPRRGSSGSFHA